MGGNESVGELFITISSWLIHWLVVLPVALIAATPFVLVAAVFDSSRCLRPLPGHLPEFRKILGQDWRAFHALTAEDRYRNDSVV